MPGPNSLRELIDQASARRFLDIASYEPRSLSEPMPFPFMAIVAQRETSEVNFAIGGESQGAAIFEFHFRSAIFARL